MSIKIDTNLIYLQNRLNLSAEKLRLYQGKSVQEIIEAEAAAGNPLAIQLAKEILTNVSLLIEIFKLTDANNKYMILMNLKVSELEKFLALLEKEDLCQGLKFFEKDKLLKMLEKIPAEQLVKTVMGLFSQEEIIKFLPERQLNKILTDNSVDKNKVLEHLKSIPAEYLAQVMETITGKDFSGKNSVQLSHEISKLDPLAYKDALTNLMPIQKQQLTLGLCKENPELYQLADAYAYTTMMDQHKEKAEIIKAMAVIDTEQILNMIKQLPKDLMAIVITQMDTEEFAKQILRRTPEVIAELMA